MNRREFFKLAAVGAATAALLGRRMTNAASASKKQTNIVLIMIDDLGWMDLHCQGNKRLDTPNIDKLASQGMRFTDAYAAAPVCSPTRAAIMTGQSPARLGITNHMPDRIQFQPDNAKLRSAKMLEHLPLEHVTLAERLKEAHYATAFLGKWHLSGRGTARDGDLAEPKLRPEHQGFDVNVGGCGFGGPPSYFEPYRIPLIKWYDDESVELYNLADDLSEKNDLSAKMPRKASDLKRKLEAWLTESGASMPEAI